MERPSRWYDYLTVNIYWFALTTRAQTLTPLVIPLLVQRFVGEESKGTHYGIIRLWALMVAVLTQALMGMFSDRSMLRWGRRRPFIVVGTLGGLVTIALIGSTANLKGMTGYWMLFVLYALSMVASDTAHAATQGLIPDLVPEERRGRYSGIKALLEVPLPLLFVALVISRLIGKGNLWGALVATMTVLLVCMLLSLLAPERRRLEPPPALDWSTILRLLLTTAVFALIIVGVGALVKAAIRRLYGQPVAVALVGLSGIAVAIILGIWVSIRISIGPGIHRDPSFAWWVVNRLAFLTAANSLSGFMLYFLQERFPGMPGESVAGPVTTSMMLVGICVLISAVLSGWLADRFGNKLLVTASGVAATVGMAVILLGPGLVALNIGGVLMGLAVGVFYTASWALGTQIVPGAQAGQYLGLSNLAGAGAGAIGAYIGGPVADSTSYVLLFAVYGTLFLLSTLSLIGIQKDRFTFPTRRSPGKRPSQRTSSPG